MNEVIERLKKEATVMTEEGLGGGYFEVDEDKFARLIILECSRIAKNQTRDNRVCDAIEQHFGIV